MLYEIHVATGRDVEAGRATISYQFRFKTTFNNQNTIWILTCALSKTSPTTQSEPLQMYTVTKSLGTPRPTGNGMVPPNNQGNATPFYNQDDPASGDPSGENPARDGVSTFDQLDRYTQQSIFKFDGKGKGYVAFAGQRDDGFYADINSIFDLLSLRNPGEGFTGGLQPPPHGVEHPDRRTGR